MSKQVELRANVPEEMVDPLEDYFCETESPYWGIMQKEVTDPYELFGIFPDEATASSVGLTEMADSEWEEQAAGADALRKLVRIKVQDDNDLKAANGALSSCAAFFANLGIYASRNSLSETAVLEKLEQALFS